jgi:molecular chaperone IbpA
MSLIDDFDRIFLGFSDQINKLDKQGKLANLHKKTNYPPHNIIKESDNSYLIEIACAGFNQNDIAIEVSDGYLNISATTDVKDDHTIYLWKGIAARNFSKKFIIEDNMVVRGASLTDGMLKIVIDRIIPEAKKPKLIQIDKI